MTWPLLCFAMNSITCPVASHRPTERNLDQSLVLESEFVYHTSEDPGSTVRTLLLTPRSEILGVIYLPLHNVRTNLKEVEIFKVLAKEKPRSALFGHTA